MDLTAEDQTELKAKLEENTGTKESIKTLRKWIIGRAHSTAAIGVVIKTYILELAKPPLDGTSQGEEEWSAKFKSILHTIYAINDAFYNKAEATTCGPYTTLLSPEDHRPVDLVSCIFPVLTTIFRLVLATFTKNDSHS